MPPVLRILDANANRAREALRVMEEAARFVLDDAALTADLKALRHDLARALSAIDGLELNRDTPGDVGTGITTDTERTRAGVADVADAAGKRLTEALRAIEEYGKTLGDSVGPAGFAAAVEKQRYRAYELERRLRQAMAASTPRQWRLCVLLTESLCTHHRWQDVLAQALDAGADCIQVREKQMDGGWLKRRVEDVMAAVAGRAGVIVNDRADVAMAAGADGVHLGQTDLACADARRLFGRQFIVGVSTNNLDQAARALRQGADYVGLGPMFPTSTVDNKPNVVGPGYARAFLEAHPGVPHLAIGGVTPANIAELAAAGIRGTAVSSAVCSANSPGDVCRRLLDAMAPCPG